MQTSLLLIAHQKRDFLPNFSLTFSGSCFNFLRRFSPQPSFDAGTEQSIIERRVEVEDVRGWAKDKQEREQEVKEVTETR